MLPRFYFVELRNQLYNALVCQNRFKVTVNVAYIIGQNLSNKDSVSDGCPAEHRGGEWSTEYTHL